MDKLIINFVPSGLMPTKQRNKISLGVNMKVAIMHPYLFPYLGYFQLINAVDIAVFFDDVQFSKGRSWHNRNFYLAYNKSSESFTFSLKKIPFGSSINECSYSDRFDIEKKIFISYLHSIYQKAPRYLDVIDLLHEIFTFKGKNLANFNIFSLQKISSYLGLNTTLLISSNLDKDNSLKGRDKVLNICKLLNANCYINSIGGLGLYTYDDFKKESLELKFLRMTDVYYKQFAQPFVPSLSIIDVMMFNTKIEIARLLREYELI